MRNNKKKEDYKDDGRTVYNMNVDGFKWYNKKPKESIYVDKEDKRIMIKAAYKQYLKILLIILLAFGLTALLIFLWLK